MIQTGVVVEIENGIAKIQINDSEGCGGGCSGCKGCSIGEETLVEAENPIGAKVGELVNIELKGDLYLKTAALIYGLPLLVLLIGVGVGTVLPDILNVNFSKELSGSITGIVFWLASYLIVKAIEKKTRLGDRARYVLIEVL